jgi:hypothetical protein
MYTEGSGEKTAAKSEKETDPQRAMLMALVKDPRPRRDPFEPIGSPMPQEAAPVQPVASQTATPTKHVGGGPRNLGGSYAGSPGPYNPLPDGGQIGSPSATTDLTKAAPLRQPNEFAYRVKGILNGPKPMAVFEDDSGNQRLVPLGGSVDGDSKVVGIEKGKVHIRHKGKDKVVDLSEGQ